MNVVIVESPAKAKTINKYLGSDYKVLASYGHVRDLLSKDGSVETENDFEMHWETDGRAVKVMKEITDAVKSADKIILATDPDREGEAISWHILEILQQKRAIKKGAIVERVAFNAITKSSVAHAMAHPRQIDGPLVSAYLARRALDYLVGFNLSPVLWRKLHPSVKSAGRVQSVALRLVCDREAEREAFKTDEYWTIEAQLKTAKADDVMARLVSIQGTALDRLGIQDEASATAIKAAIENNDFKIAAVDKKPTKRNPYPPFTTSTLQMDASRRLGLDAKQAMQVAQKLYEGIDIGGGETVGLITYMRTDGVDIIPEAVAEIRAVITSAYGANYTPVAREYKSKAKNAQEAHEAIRPTDPARTPDAMKKYLDKEQAGLYDLIWKRTVASQMAAAEMEQTTVTFEVKGRDSKSYGLRTTGSVVVFDGFLKVYEEARDDRVHALKGKDDAADAEEETAAKRLPVLSPGDVLRDKQIDADQHFTQPPPRFTEASLVKRMEELGIGRPSTFASTMAVLRDRDYVRMEKKQLVPEDKGRLVTGFLKSFFQRYVEYDFTADLEEKLDLISDDKLAYKDVLRDFWLQLTAAIAETKELRTRQVLDTLNDVLGSAIFPPREDGSDGRRCPICDGGMLSLKVGKNGAFIACSNYENGCRFSRSFSNVNAGADGATPDGRLIGEDPDTGLPVTLRAGRFGTYLQLGDGEPKTKDNPQPEKPKRSSIPKGIDAATIDLEKALQLLRLPREIGPHPETGSMITAALGKFGPYIKHETTYANVESIEDVFTIGINHAVTVIAEKVAGGGKGGFKRAAPTVLKEVGEHPAGGKIEVLSGKYGSYIKWDNVNATLPKTQELDTLTVEIALDIIAERIAKGGIKPKKGKAAPKKKAASKAAKAADSDAGPKKKTAAKAKAGTGPKAKAKAAAPAKAKKSPADAQD
jgi:DNA topoisomerase I